MSQQPFSSGITQDDLNHVASQLFARCGTLSDISGLEPQQLDAVYSQAYHLYEQGKNEQAARLFQFLCLYNHWEKSYWMGLAASRQALKQYPQAIEAYSYLTVLDPANPQAPLHGAYCYLAMDDLEGAEKSLSAVMHLANQEKKYAILREQAELLLYVVEEKKQQINTD
jgi:type III secretion system low calcium response chaperone LcrH/SycD